MDNEAVTPQQLADILRNGQRNELTVKQTKPFLDQIAARLQAKVGHMRTSVGYLSVDIKQQPSIQYVDRAYFELAYDIPKPGFSGNLSLAVLLTVDGRLWWGIYLNTSQSTVERLRDAFEKLGLAEPGAIRLEEGLLGTKAWPGGTSFALGREMTAEEVAQQPDLDALADTIAGDLAEWHGRVTPHLEELRQMLKQNPDKATMDTEMLEELAASFAQELSTSKDLQAHMEDHQRRIVRAQAMLTPQRIPTLTEAELRELFFDTDAFGFWQNKEREFEQRLQSVGIDGLRQSLLELVSCAERGLTVDDLKRIWAMRGLGRLLTTEFLTYRFPDRYWTYSSNVTLPALQFLGDDVKGKLPRGQKSDPYLYAALEPRMAEARRALQDVGVSHVDNALVDIFVWWVKSKSTGIPDVDGAKIEQALRDFDAQKRSQANWANWQSKPFHKYAISWQGQQYPVKEIVRMATGFSEFTAAQARPYLEKRGFRIVRLAADSSGVTTEPAGDTGDDSNSRSVDVLELLSNHLAASGLHFTSWQLATFYTALQTKGFVILSGISGTGKTKLAQHFAALLPQPTEPAATQNWLFFPVRPDWRDSKSLLGYYNPLTSHYEGTSFLSFLLQAVQNYRERDGLAWFVILDEMNLAHVEYYFADLLSVLESGRDEDGWTREPLRTSYPGTAEGDLPPRELRLPPNLYIVGTVNVDETTHAFSPKVLDRAFTLELTEADFSGYPPATDGELAAVDKHQRQMILQDFRRKDRFARIDKREIAEYVQAHDEVRKRLQTLNDLLRPHNLHFGYRVFDEIVSFLAAAEANGLYEDIGGAEAAFDAAVLMKVLPKFHGSRGKLETPLRRALAWCSDPDRPEAERIDRILEQVQVSEDLVGALSHLTYRCAMTAERASRMLRHLYADGYAAFG